MINMMDQMNMLTSMDWRNAFAAMEAEAAARANNMKGPYTFFGEIDDPFEMLRYPNVTLEMVQYAGKTNWLRDSEGNFITVNDATVDELADAGKLLHSSYEEDYDDDDYYGEYDAPKTEYDRLKTVEERVKYRMDHQHVDERLAKELVSEDEGFNAFKYRFFVHQTFTSKTDEGEIKTYEFDEEIDADSADEAVELAKTYSGWHVGLNIHDGLDYSCNPPKRFWETIIDLKSEIKHTIEL